MRLGKYSYPKYRLGFLLNDTKKIYDQFGGKETQAEFIAGALGQEPKSGSFIQKLADLKNYGLLESAGNNLRVSDLGKRVTYAVNEKEKQEAINQAVLNIPLWDIIYQKNGMNIKEEGFWIDLAEITGIERPEAQSASNLVRKAYLEDARYIKPVEKPVEPTTDMMVLAAPTAQTKLADTILAPDRKQSMEVQTQQPQSPSIVGNKGSMYIEIRYPGHSSKTDITDETDLDDDLESIEMAQQYLEIIKKRVIKRKQMPKNNEIKEELPHTEPIGN